MRKLFLGSFFLAVLTGHGAYAHDQEGDPEPTPHCEAKTEPVDQFQAAMQRLEKGLSVRPELEPEIARIAAQLDIEKPDTLLALINVAPLNPEFLQDLGPEPMNATPKPSLPEQGGIVVNAAARMLAAIPIPQTDRSSEVLADLKTIEDSRQLALAKPKTGVWSVLGGFMSRSKTTVIQTFTKETVLSRVTGFQEKIQADIDQTKNEILTLDNVRIELMNSLLAVRVNLAAALRVRQLWRGSLLATYEQRFALGEIDEIDFRSIGETIAQLDRIIVNDLIIMESNLIHMINVTLDKLGEGRSLMLQFHRILTQSVPNLITTMALYFNGQSQKAKADFVTSVRDFTNSLAEENIKIHAEVAEHIAKEVERGIIDPETMQFAFTSLTDLFSKRIAIAREAATARLTNGVAMRTQLGQFLESARKAQTTTLQIQLTPLNLNAPKVVPSLPEKKSSTPSLNENVIP